MKTILPLATLTLIAAVIAAPAQTPKNGESLLDTRPNPLPKRPDWGDVSTSKKGDVLYLHILEWPESGKITLDGLKAKATKAIYLQNGKDAKFTQKDGKLTV